jgi:AraC-like DNA-binding protein
VAVDQLAAIVAMSRTSFAVRFKAAAGVAPLTYLSNWRMRTAEQKLRETPTTVATLALSLDYTSESAFSNAFKRATGAAPSRYRSRSKETNRLTFVAADASDPSISRPAP